MIRNSVVSATSRTVLVVEDDALVRLLAVELLDEAGHVVHEAPSAREALRVLERVPGIDIVFTDVNMPIGMNGVRLAAVIRERWPQMEVILTSGAWRPQVMDLPQSVRFLAKPYDPAQILDAVSGRSRP